MAALDARESECRARVAELRKQIAEISEAGLRDVAPSTDLRHWYHHDRERFADFHDRYIAELEAADHRPAVKHLRDLAAHDKATLLTATKDLDHSEAPSRSARSGLRADIVVFR
ncbi:DUF488 domain-containing protein [Streptomyces sp. NPDC000880]